MNTARSTWQSTRFRRYVIQLAKAAGYQEALIARIFPLKVRYNFDIRYLAVFISNDQHLLELHPSSRREFAVNMVITTALTRTLATARRAHHLHVWRPNVSNAALRILRYTKCCRLRRPRPLDCRLNCSELLRRRRSCCSVAPRFCRV